MKVSALTWGLLGVVAVGAMAGIYLMVEPSAPHNGVELSKPQDRPVALAPAVVAPEPADAPPSSNAVETPPPVNPVPATQPAAAGPAIEPARSTPPPKVAVGPLAQKNPSRPAKPGGKKQPPAAPEAREALSRVGVDSAAEDVWVHAINDPGLSVDERKNLIEDLNEDGFPDPKNLTADDLPLIVNRLKLIEQMAPDAMDDANRDAFAEAYKDLIKMAEKVTRLREM